MRKPTKQAAVAYAERIHPDQWVVSAVHTGRPWTFWTISTSGGNVLVSTSTLRQIAEVA